MVQSRILVVDDEEIVRQSICACLEQADRDVVAVKDGHTAIEKIREEEWDVALVDLRMPGIDGIEVLKTTGKLKPHIAVIIITAYATVENAVEAMKAGAVDYIVKPVTPDELRIRVDKALEKKMLIAENVLLKQELGERYRFDNIIGKSAVMQEVFQLIEKVAPTDSTILIRGDSGTGKELIARAIHHHSLRKDKKFIAVDCGALPETLLESELFGHIKGSFTGATMTKRGLLEVADGGTFFLDEVGDLSTGIQSKLLRFLQEKEFRPVGGVKNITVDVRLIAATNKDLEKMIKEQQFREDLYYRLNIVPIRLPSLSERKEDIPLLVQHFLAKYNKKQKKNVEYVSPDALQCLIDNEWSGNVRELENIVERMVIMCEERTIDMRHLPPDMLRVKVVPGISVPRTNAELKELKKKVRASAVARVERAFLIDALTRNDWNVSRTARDVRMKRQNLQALMKKYSIKQ